MAICLRRSPSDGWRRSLGSTLPKALAVGVGLTACNTYDPSLLPENRGPGTESTDGLGGAVVAATSAMGPAVDDEPPTSTFGNGASSLTPSHAEPSGGGGSPVVSAGGSAGTAPAAFGDSAVSGGESAQGGTSSGGVSSATSGAGGETSLESPTGGTAGLAAGSGGGNGGSDGGAESGGEEPADAGVGGGASESEPCPGCARLSVPLDADGDRAHFTLTLPSPTDLSAAVLTLRVARVEGTGGTFRAYVQQGADGSFSYATGADTALSSIGTALEDIVWDLEPVAASFDLMAIERIGIEIDADGSSSWSNPTVLVVDRIDVSGASPALASWTFDTADSVHETPVEVYTPGPMWLNSYSADTTATGSEVGWVGP